MYCKVISWKILTRIEICIDPTTLCIPILLPPKHTVVISPMQLRVLQIMQLKISNALEYNIY